MQIMEQESLATSITARHSYMYPPILITVNFYIFYSEPTWRCNYNKELKPINTTIKQLRNSIYTMLIAQRHEVSEPGL